MKTHYLTLFVFLAGASISLSQDVKNALVVSSSGKVSVEFPGQSDQIASVGSPLEVGQYIKTGENGEVTLALHQGLAVTLKANTDARLISWAGAPKEDLETKRKATLEITAGRMVVLVTEEMEDLIDFRIQTPKGIAKPRGTFYAVQVIEGNAFLAVKEGKVGLDQFVPLEYQEVEVETVVKKEERSYGTTTTTSPRG